MKKNVNHRVAIFIIAYQAAQTLISAYKRIPPFLKHQSKEIYCFDDCSNDNTYYMGLGYKIANNIKNFTLDKNPRNLGYGGNQKKGYRYGMKKNYDLVVMLHGDAQYAPEKMPLLLEPFYQKDWENIGMVMGSRMMGKPLEGGMPVYKYVGNKILTWLENIILGTNLTEFHSGYRVFNLHALRDIPFEKCSNDFHFDSEIIIMMLQAGYRIVEVPIPTYYGPGSKSSVNVFKYGINCLKSVVDYRLHLLGFIPKSKFNFPISTKRNYRYKESEGSSHQQIADKIKRLGCKNILDLGCSGGFVAQALGKKWRGTITGIEIDKSWSSIPGLERYKQVIWKDLNKDKINNMFKGNSFDAVVAGDILEHLNKPQNTIAQSAKLLKPGGYFITSLPNSRFLPVLFLRKFFSTLRMAKGPLDITHKHFYNISTAKKLFDKQTFTLVGTKATPFPLYEINSISSDNGFFRLLYKMALTGARLLPSYLGYQIILIHQLKKE